MLLIPDGKSPEHYADWAKKIGASVFPEKTPENAQFYLA